MFLSNIGNEFKKQMENWLEQNPEIIHCWQKNQLKINHPKEFGEFIVFHFDSKSIRIINGKKEKIFKRKLFENIEEQVYKIRGFWINEMLEKEDTEIVKPIMKDNQIAVMFGNSNYGQVLTTSKNIFTGWGDVFKIFESEEETRRFINSESNDEKIEIHVYDSEYNIIELEKEK